MALDLAVIRFNGGIGASPTTFWAGDGTWKAPAAPSNNVPWVAAGGTPDGITATYVPALTSLTDGLLAFVRATAANTTTAPTFSPNGLTAEVITKDGGRPLAPGDIPGAN